MTFNGTQTFWSCETGDDDQVNIYTLPSGANCVEITLVMDSCRPACVDGVPQPPYPTDESSSASEGTSPETTPLPSSQGTSPGGSSEAPGPTVTDEGSTPSLPTTPPTTPISPTNAPDTNTNTNTGTGTSTDTTSPTPPTAPVPAPLSAPSDCPVGIFGNEWEYPVLMVPVDRANPTVTYGPSLFGQISPNASTLFNFEIPQAYEGLRCTLFFAFPSTRDVDPSNYTFTYPHSQGEDDCGFVDFNLLNSPASASTTFDTAPGVAIDFGTRALRPGDKSIVWSFPCPAGQTVTFSMQESRPADGAVGGESDTCLYYCQETQPTPFGLYIAKC